MASSISALPAVAMVDPSATVLSDISGATVSESDMRQLRLGLLLLLPLCGGFVLSIALSLLAGTGDASFAEPALKTGAGLDKQGGIKSARPRKS